jgi:signal transduction histidine kinase
MLADVPGFWILDKQLRIRDHKTLRLENGSDFIGYTNKVLFDGDDNLWCGTNKGLYRYNVASGKMRPVNYLLLSNEVMGSIWIKDMIRLRDSSIIFSTYVGLYRMTIESGKPTIKPIIFLRPGDYDGFGPLFEDEAGTLYVKSLAHFLYILREGEKGSYKLVKSIPFMPEVNQYYRVRGDSVVYVATTEGVYRVNSNTFIATKQDFGARLPFFNVNMVFKDNHQLWVFGEKGLYFFDTRNKQGRTYTVDDGLPANEFIPSSLALMPDQRCIAGTTNGLVSFYPNRLQDSLYSPKAQLTGIYINDVPYVLSPNADEIDILDLSYRQNTLAFDFSAIAFQHVSECCFEYMLGGYDEGWIPAGTVNHTRYSKIPPGDYVFKLRVTDAMGRVSPYLKEVQIQIAKAFWQTNGFKAIVLAVMLLGGWLLSRAYFSYKLKKQKREFEKKQLIEKERTRIATDMHDDLGAGLSRIRFLSQSILNKNIRDEAIKPELEKITSFSDEMSEKMGEIVWALNQKNDTLADLIAYTRSYAAEYLANHNIQCHADTPLNLPGTFITGETRRNIFLSVKECLHNIVKHSGATKVFFSVELNGSMQIVIHDNGKGIDWDNRRAFSNGIENIKKRMKEINGQVNFSNDQGTKVSLSIPLNL